jgi:hypothetical protein
MENQTPHGTPHVFLHHDALDNDRAIEAMASIAQQHHNKGIQVTVAGQTQHFRVEYQTALGAAGQQVAAAVLARCEGDYTAVSGFFGGITPPGMPFQIVITALEPNHNGSGGAMHQTCAAVTLLCDVKTVPQVDTALTNMLVVAEEVEVFSAAFGHGWDCGASNGEGLSRVLATQQYPAELDGYASAHFWLDSPGRPDIVNQTLPTDRDRIGNGCAVLFLNYLHVQLGFTWQQIIAAGAPTLGETYTNLTGKSDGFDQFKALLATHFPVGTPSGLTTDNPFPL